MDKQIVLAKRAMRQAARSNKKLPMKRGDQNWKVGKVQPSMKMKKDFRLNGDYSLYIERAILITIALAVLSVFYDRLGYLAGVFSILIVAAIIDTKLKHVDEKPKEEESNNIRHTQAIKRSSPAIEIKPRQMRDDDLFIPFDITESNGETVTMTVFPYKRSV